jgi:hypothetical protein
LILATLSLLFQLKKPVTKWITLLLINYYYEGCTDKI